MRKLLLVIIVAPFILRDQTKQKEETKTATPDIIIVADDPEYSTTMIKRAGY